MNEPMPSDAGKESFLKQDMLPALGKLQAGDKGEWGSMNAQQMVEHLADAFRNYQGLASEKIWTPADKLEPVRAFLMSDKDFRPNTRHPKLPETPLPLRCANMEEALQDLREAMDAFFDHFEKRGGTVTNPIFGKLDYAAYLHLHYKHARHHLRQFGVFPH